MNELFLQLCVGVAAALEMLKPAIRNALNVEATDAPPLYQTIIWLLAAVIGIAGAVALQVNVTPSWLGVPDALGFVFTGVIATFGSEVAHRILEVIESVSIIFQNRAASETVTVSSGSTTSYSSATVPGHDKG